MEQDSNHTVLCKMGCGFYGNHSYEGMCSKCYKDHVKRQQQQSPAAGRSSPGSGSCGTTSASQLLLQSPTSPAAVSSSATTVAHVTPPVTAQIADSQRTPEKASPIDVAEMSSPSTQLDDSADSPSKLKKRNRCFSCRKKVGLTGFECRCGGLFCGLHRYSDKHNCAYDYRADGREQIAKANPVIVGEKIKKI